ncbi:MAG TPA: nucleoside deaminase [Patescibacteria group bacterium]|nr:nucleoside deaminase [Patescibacteria group bacterium]
MDNFLDLAIKEAEKSFENGDYPVGAVLVIDNKLVAVKNNSGESTKNYSNHAETQLILDNAKDLLVAWKQNKEIILYSTLEPCLMCLGVATMNKISKIFYIQKDPHAGACGIDVKSLGVRYQESFPKIEYVNYSQRPKELIMEFLSNQIEKGVRVEWSKKFLELLENKS